MSHFYDTVRIIHDIIYTPNPYPDSAKFVSVTVKRIKDEQIRHCKINRICTKCCCISKTSNSVGRKDNCLAKAQQLSIVNSLNLVRYF